MHRWVVVAALLGLVLAACHSKSSPLTVGDDDGGDDDGGPCVCTVGSQTFACAVVACIDGFNYLCTSDGTLPEGICTSDAGGDGSADATDEGDCIPTCNGEFCNVSNNCGGLCKCNVGVTCNPNGSCGNGCSLSVEDPCLPDGGSSTTCCQSGYACLASDSGVSTCCAVTGGTGSCTVNTDCCDYPKVTCNKTTGSCG